MFEKDYFTGKTSNYKLGYKMLDNRLIWAKRINKVLNLIDKGSLLDIGCAYGYFIKYMKGEGFKVKGVDVSEHAIEKARKILGSDVAVHDITNPLNFKEKFDVITAFDVLEHLPNQEKALNNIKKVLKSEGLLIIEMPIKCDNKLIKLLHNDHDPTHNYLLTHDETINLMNKCGFKVAEEQNILALFRGLIMIKTNKPKNFIELTLKKI